MEQNPATSSFHPSIHSVQKASFLSTQFFKRQSPSIRSYFSWQAKHIPLSPFKVQFLVWQYSLFMSSNLPEQPLQIQELSEKNWQWSTLHNPSLINENLGLHFSQIKGLLEKTSQNLTLQISLIISNPDTHREHPNEEWSKHPSILFTHFLPGVKTKPSWQSEQNEVIRFNYTQ